VPTVEVNGETLHYVKSGTGPAVVFVHYLGGFSRQWRRQIAALEDRFTCIAFDQRGYGYSSFNGRWDPENSAADLKSGLDALGIEEAHFVAYSMAGPVMLTFNAHWGYMLRSLMLIDTFARNDRGTDIRNAESEKIEVVVLNCWVTETKDTPCRSNRSTSLAKSASERVRRSTL
jgi:pimeloyl-ACP methyl ester carboxylesterase